jgi:hypothetical protein
MASRKPGFSVNVADAGNPRQLLAEVSYAESINISVTYFLLTLGHLETGRHDLHRNVLCVVKEI